MLKHFYGSLIFTVVALGLATWYGFSSGGVTAALSFLWIALVLSILEVSLSFDNAVVNAKVLKDMSPVWQQRFLTWGILIAVFGMRIVFPIIIVAIAARVDPIEAVRLALGEPERYAQIIEGANTGLMGFGGAFLLLVGLKFFFDADKEHDWIAALERPLKKFANFEAFAIILALLLIYGISTQLAAAETITFLTAGIFGITTFYAVEWVGNLLEAPDAVEGAAKTGLAAFLYLEVLDASFSFDGVIGAFALTNNLIIIALGLGIGAMFVRSMTIYLVPQGTLSQFRYLEHGAFWAILALAVIMLSSPIYLIPETITGLIGALLIGLALWSSVRHNRAHPDDALGEAAE